MAGTLPLKNDVQPVTQLPQSRRQVLDVLSAAESVLPISNSEVTCGPMTRPATLSSSAKSSSNSTDFSSITDMQCVCARRDGWTPRTQGTRPPVIRGTRTTGGEPARCRWSRRGRRSTADSQEAPTRRRSSAPSRSRWSAAARADAGPGDASAATKRPIPGPGSSPYILPVFTPARASILALFRSVLFCSSAVLDPTVGHTVDVLSPFTHVLCAFEIISS